MSGYVLPASQRDNTSGLRKEWQIIQSSSLPVWGSSFTIDYRQNNVFLHNMVLQFNLGALSNTTNGYLTPSDFFIDHIDVLINGKIITTYYATPNFLARNLFEFDEDRGLENQVSGMYDNTTQRQAMAATSSTYYLHLKTFVDQCKELPVLQTSQNIQLKVFLAPLANIISGTATGAQSVQINSINLLCKVSLLPEPYAVSLRTRKMGHYKYSEIKLFSTTINSGVTSSNNVLTSITGNVAFIVFVVRDSNKVQTGLAHQFNKIQSYELMNSSNQNICGGNPLQSHENLIVTNDHVMSSYLRENDTGANDQKANVYLYSFCENAAENWRNGISCGQYMFSGAEVLKLTFATALTTAAQLDVYAYCDNFLKNTQRMM